MDRISQIKKDLLIREWVKMVRECRSSGFTVKEWCKNNGINIKTYYYRLKRVRNFICDSKLKNNIDGNISPVRHDIVPIGAMPYNDAHQIKLIASDISVELPLAVSPQLLKAAIEGLKC